MSEVDKQCKKCRRAGEKLFLKGEKCNSPKCPMIKRNFPPGAHGQGGFSRVTNYGRQLKEKQKAKRIYGLMEKQFRNYFEKAFKKVGNTAEILFKSLEGRLDNTIFRLGLASSRKEARQMVGHGHFKVNDRKVDIPSYQVKVGDIITIRDKSLKSLKFENLVEKMKDKEFAPWLNFDVKEMKGKVTGQAKMEDVGLNIDWRMIIEFYSK
ncbi:MAG TPA: 30S ribosomal protein S4 [Patescibacteria group bacterium]|nr:30S ribosomal protein S4 [Patescibacteria group bacterium]